MPRPRATTATTMMTMTIDRRANRQMAKIAAERAAALRRAQRRYMSGDDAAERAARDLDPRHALKSADSYSRMGALLALQREPDFWQLVGEKWPSCDNIAAHARELRFLLTVERSCFPIWAAMGDEARAFYAALPPVLRVWRGCYRFNTRGFSWTTDRHLAARFPSLNRYWRPRAQPWLLGGLVCREHIAFVCTDRGEAEVVALPRDVETTSREALPRRQFGKQRGSDTYLG
jgi:hypothetical protein